MAPSFPSTAEGVAAAEGRGSAWVESEDSLGGAALRAGGCELVGGQRPEAEAEVTVQRCHLK